MKTNKQLVKFILENANKFEWSVQGLGMMRLYITPELRLHIWDERLEAPGATKAHTHPWDLESEVIVGAIEDVVLSEKPAFLNQGKLSYAKQQILCGEGCHLTSEPEPVELYLSEMRTYRAGQKYTHKADDIHYSNFSEGTVTLVHRTFKEDQDHAFVYIPEGSEFGSAEPKPATQEQVYGISQTALNNWFKQS